MNFIQRSKTKCKEKNQAEKDNIKHLMAPDQDHSSQVPSTLKK